MPTVIDPSCIPCSPSTEAGGLIYFPRMLAKIRLHAKGQLWKELHENLGKGSDAMCCGYLHITYEALKARVLEGGTDEEIMQWCQQHGRPLNTTDKLVWNHYYIKLGMSDDVTPKLAQRKAQSGLGRRDDILTMAHYIDVDEGRKP